MWKQPSLPYILAKDDTPEHTPVYKKKKSIEIYKKTHCNMDRLVNMYLKKIKFYRLAKWLAGEWTLIFAVRPNWFTLIYLFFKFMVLSYVKLQTSFVIGFTCKIVLHLIFIGMFQFILNSEIITTKVEKQFFVWYNLFSLNYLA